MNQSLNNLVEDLVKIDSRYPNEQKISEFLFDYLKTNNFRVEKQEIATNRFNLLATKGNSDKYILFYGHLDTVPLVNEKDWTTKPLEPVIKSKKLYGLGASDMKGGLASFLEATKDSNTAVKIFLASDEENISEGAWKAVTENKKFFEDVELIISAEPSFGLGLNGITVGRTGRCIYELTFKGKAEHIIKYKEAVDALEKLSNFGVKLYKVRENIFNSKDTVAQLRKVSGESIGMSVCGEAKAEVEVILGAEDSAISVLKIIQSLTDADVVLKPRKTPYLEGYYFHEFPHKKILENTIIKHTQEPIQLHKRKSVGDDNVLASLGIPVLTWGPVGGNEHKPNEYVELESLHTLSKMYKEFLDNINEGGLKLPQNEVV